MKVLEDAEYLRELGWSFRASRVLQIANRMGIFDLLSRGNLSSWEIAEKCGSDLEMTEKILIACASLKLIELENGKYSNSQLANRYLVKDSHFYQGNWIEHAYNLWDYWSRIGEHIGGTAEEKPQDKHRTFIMAMHDLAMGGEAEELANHVDLKGKRRLFDVGGGPGTFSIILCQHYPQLKAVLFDLPETIKIAREVIDKWGMSHKIETREGDWNRDDFGKNHDVMLMSNVLHGPESGGEMKLRKAYRSMVSGGLLMIRDFILDENKTGPVSPAMFNMMVGAYSIDEITDLLIGVGFEDVKELSISHKTHSIIVAQKP